MGRKGEVEGGNGKGTPKRALAMRHVGALTPTRAGTCDRMDRGTEGKLPNSSCKERENGGDVSDYSGGRGAEVSLCAAKTATKGGKKTLQLIWFYGNKTKPVN